LFGGKPPINYLAKDRGNINKPEEKHMSKNGNIGSAKKKTRIIYIPEGKVKGKHT